MKLKDFKHNNYTKIEEYKDSLKKKNHENIIQIREIIKRYD